MGGTFVHHLWLRRRIPLHREFNPDDSIGSIFKSQMGSKHGGGTIFETNVLPLDVGPVVISSPWDRVLSFHLNGPTQDFTHSVLMP